jgi:hypothetical protein
MHYLYLWKNFPGFDFIRQGPCTYNGKYFGYTGPLVKQGDRAFIASINVLGEAFRGDLIRMSERYPGKSAFRTSETIDTGPESRYTVPVKTRGD